MDIECDKCGEVFGRGFHRYIQQVEVDGEVEDHCITCRKKDPTGRMHEALKSAATQAYRAHQSTGSEEAHRIFVALHNLRESTQDK